MDIRKLQRAIVDGLEDVKAQDIVVFNTEKLSPLFERVIIASGTSNRQTKALASSVRETVKKRGLPVMATEGQDNGEWIIVDCGAAVAHIMQPAIREYYHLEEIWGGKSVKLKTLEARGPAKGLPKASEPAAAVPAKPGAGASAAKRSATKASATKASAAKPAMKKATAGGASQPRTAARKTTAAPARSARSAAGKALAGKAPARPLAGHKPAAKGAARGPTKSPTKSPTKGMTKSATKGMTKSATGGAAKSAARGPARGAARKAPR